MELYLIRHAVAEERGPRWPNDDLRPLSATGVTKFERIAEGLVRLGALPEQIFTSPLVRASQTAEILSRVRRQRVEVVPLPALAPGHAPAAVVADLARRSKATRVAVVGHEPDLGALTAHILGSRLPVPFKKGAVCSIDIPQMSPPGTLTWFLPPSVLRALGRGR
jgi:phosphohistidine phosphatase